MHKNAGEARVSNGHILLNRRHSAFYFLTSGQAQCFCSAGAQATASGTLSVYFYDTLAGSKGLEPTSIAARANPQVRLHALAHT